MGVIDAEARVVLPGTAGPCGPIIYVIDLPYHEFDLTAAADGLGATVVKLPVADWDASLTPWPAPSPYRGRPDFGGRAAATLDELSSRTIPQIEQAEGLNPGKRAICGYSLAGLFSLYAFVRDRRLAACGCLSGSVWYEGWTNYLRTLDFNGEGRYAFLSLGSREKNAPQPIVRTVQDSMATCADILRAHGCTVEYVIGPGNHFAHTEERFRRGLAALDHFLVNEHCQAQPSGSPASTAR